MKKIFVGNLSWKVTEENLKPLFEAYGEVVYCKVITDQYTGKSRGFAFVEMADAASAKTAIEQLNGKLVLEREIRVSLAQERPARSGGGRERERDSYRSYNGARSYQSRSFDN